MRLQPLSLAPVVLLVATLSACQPAGEATPAASTTDAAATARAAINEANSRIERALNARHRVDYLDGYGERVTMMSIDAPDLVGRAEFGSSLGAEWEAARDSGVVITWKADTIEVHGDDAYEVGRGMAVRSRNGGARDTTRSKYITFWHKDADGAWRISRDLTVRLPKAPQ